MLNVLLWAPLAGALLALVLPRALARWAGVLGSLVALGLAIALVLDFGTGSAGLQHVVDESWIPDLGVRYQLGVDGISLFLVLLTTVLWFASTLWSALRGEPSDGRDRLYYFLVGLAETAALGAFLSQDLLLFVLFFDLMLIPFFFLIGTFGGRNRIAATTKMIVYTLVGSLLMLVAAIATAILASGSVGELTFSIPVLQQHLLSSGSQYWIFCFFAAAFLVKMPAFPIHGWMPDAYRAAPLPVLILLSAVLSKVGAYGFLRVVLPLYPQATAHFQELVMLIALASILYGSVMAFTKTNIRLIAGYSSVAQLGFITLGIFSLRPDGADGAVLQMVNHGLVVGAIFMVIAIVHARTKTDEINEMGGQAMRAPVLAAMFLVIAMANLAIPGSSNFAGEFYILNGVFQSKIALALIAVIGIALAAFYTLRMYQKVMHNRLPEGAESREIGIRDGIVLAPLVALIIALALWPGLILERGQDAVTETVGAVALADCGIEGAYINRSAGADQTAELVTAGREGCTQQYGVSPIEAISATLPCGTTQAQGAGYLIKFCDDMTALR
jgi:NADH-quinone oxidoreductase subunit M